MNKLSMNVTPLKSEDIKSTESLRKYYVREAIRFHNTDGIEGLKVYLLFLIYEQKFIKMKRLLKTCIWKFWINVDYKYKNVHKLKFIF